MKLSPDKRAGLTALIVAAAWIIAPPAVASPFLEEPDVAATGSTVGQDLVVLDFDGDGWPDIALAGGKRVELVLGREDGWDPAQSVTLSGGDTWGRTRLASADLDDDGLDDIIVAVPGTGQVAVMRGRDDGVLTEPPDADAYGVVPADASYVPSQEAALDVGDLDGDEDPDVVAMFRPSGGFDGSVVPMANDGEGGLAKGSAIVVVVPVDVQLLTLGGDSDPDLAVAQGHGGGPSDPGQEPQGLISVLPGGPGATFGAATTTSSAGDALDLAAGDLTDDGTDDLVVGVLGRTVQPGPQVLAGSQTAAQLGPASVLLGTPPVPLGAEVQVGDVDRDGHADVGVGTLDRLGVGVITTALNGQRRLESGAYTYPATVGPWRFADADADGKLDLVMFTGGSVRIYYGRGPVIQPPASFVDLGEVVLGAASTPVSGSFTNAGPGHAGNLQVVADGDVADFEVTQDGCSGASLPVGAACAMAVRFRPRGAGDRELDVAVVAEDSDVAVWMSLVGTGVQPPTPPPTGGNVAPGPAVTTTVARATLSRRGVPRVRKKRFDSGWRAGCPAGGPACRVHLLLVARAKPGSRAPVLARFSLTVPASAARDVSGKLTRAGRRALAHRKRVRAVLQITATRTGGVPATVERSVVLRRPANGRGASRRR